MIKVWDVWAQIDADRNIQAKYGSHLSHRELDVHGQKRSYCGQRL